MSTITPLPTPPQRNDPNNFATRGDAFMAALPTFVTETNTVAGEVNTNATNAATSAGTATTQAGIATTQATNAANSASSALNAPGTNATSTTSLTLATGPQSLTIQTGKAYSFGQPLVIAYATTPSIQMSGTVTSYNSGTGALVMNITAIAGSGTYANWGVSMGIIISNSAPADLFRVARTSNTALTTSDKGKFIDITSGTFTQTYVSNASLGNGWWCLLRNSGTGEITITTDSVTYIMYSGECRKLYSDGTVLNSLIVDAFSATFTTSATFTKPPGYAQFGGLAWGGGGSGARSTVDSGVTGGGGGGCTPFVISAIVMGVSEVLTIGAGGAAVTTSPTIGNNGGATTLGSLVFAGGGGGGNFASATVTTAGSGGGSTGSATGTTPGAPTFLMQDGTNNQINHISNGFGGANTGGTSQQPRPTIYGGAAGAYCSSTTVLGTPFAQTIYGGGGGGSIATSTLGAGNTTTFGGAGGAAVSASNGIAGTAPAGGGGATKTGTASGAGARGELRIWGII